MQVDNSVKKLTEGYVIVLQRGATAGQCYRIARQCQVMAMPSAALPPTALPENESVLNTELLNAGAGASPILLLLICNSVSLTPAPLLVSFSRRATLPLTALHDAKVCYGLCTFRHASIS